MERYKRRMLVSQNNFCILQCNFQAVFL